MQSPLPQLEPLSTQYIKFQDQSPSIEESEDCREFNSPTFRKVDQDSESFDYNHTNIDDLNNDYMKLNDPIHDSYISKLDISQKCMKKKSGRGRNAIKTSKLQEIIKYKKYTRGFTKTFSKKSSGNSSSQFSMHGMDDAMTTTNFSSSY